MNETAKTIYKKIKTDPKVGDVIEYINTDYTPLGDEKLIVVKMYAEYFQRQGGEHGERVPRYYKLSDKCWRDWIKGNYDIKISRQGRLIYPTVEQKEEKMKNDVIILRRLKTKDGIVSDIQELVEYRHDEIRITIPRLSGLSVTAAFEDAVSCVARPPDTRRYREKKRYQAILIEMEEV